MQTVMITGAAGFVGSHLTERYLREGWRVFGVDNFLTGREANIAHLHSNPNFKFLKQDVAEDCDLRSPWGDPFRLVMHFACPASPIDFEDLAEEIMAVDSRGTFQALRVAKRDGATFFLASTSEIYGDPLVHPQTEDYWGNVNTIGPRSCYDEAKRFSEAATMVYRRKYGVDTRIVRIFNTYGPRMRLNDGRVVPMLCSQALKGEPFSIYGDGMQTRSFCFVTDLVDGIYRLSQANYQEPVNIGNPGEYTINQFAETIEKILNKKVPRDYRPAREDDPRRRKPDITRAREILKWEPKINLEDGLRETIATFQRELK